MRMLPLSPEICRNIASALSTGHSSRRDLLALCLTCKPLQHEATPYLYGRLSFSDPARCLVACGTLTSGTSARLGLYVRSFGFTPDTRQTNSHGLPRAFWEAIQRALRTMHNLEILVLSDFSFSNSFVLDPEPNASGAGFAFELKEARLRLSYDTHLLRFLKSQNSLRILQLYGGIDDSDPLSASTTPPLPALQIFDGPLLFGARLLCGCSTTAQVRQIQLVVDCERTSVLPLLRSVAEALHKTLSTVNVMDLHGEDIGVDVLGIFAEAGANLKHIGVLPYPMTGRYHFHKHLITLGTSLRSIELDLTRWNPIPAQSAPQRVLADELRTFCPTLRVIFFWIGGARVRWSVHSNSADAERGAWDQWVTRVDGDMGQGEGWS